MIQIRLDVTKKQHMWLLRGPGTCEVVQVKKQWMDRSSVQEAGPSDHGARPRKRRGVPAEDTQKLDKEKKRINSTMNSWAV